MVMLRDTRIVYYSIFLTDFVLQPYEAWRTAKMEEECSDNKVAKTESEAKSVLLFGTDEKVTVIQWFLK